MPQENDQWVLTLEYAVSDEDGLIQFYTPIRGSGLSSVHERNDVGINQETYQQIEVPRKRIDTVLKELEVQQIDLLKMDIEGHELNALTGATSAIASKRISRIMFEFGSANVNSRTYFIDFWNMLQDRYNLFRILPCGNVFPIDSYSENLEYFRGSTNYFALLK
jgi:FkbM family methyltransferase